MEKIIYNLKFAFDYYIGYFLYNDKTQDKWRKQIISEYPDKFPNEHKYLNQKNGKSNS